MISQIIDSKFYDCQQPIHLHKLPYTKEKPTTKDRKQNKKFGGENKHNKQV